MSWNDVIQGRTVIVIVIVIVIVVTMTSESKASLRISELMKEHKSHMNGDWCLVVVTRPSFFSVRWFMQSKYVMKYVCEFLWLKLEVRIECLLILKLEVRIECLLIPLSRGSLYNKSRHLWCSVILGCVLMFVLGHL